MFHIEIKGLGKVSVDTLEELDSLKMKYLNSVPQLKSEPVTQIPVISPVETKELEPNKVHTRKGDRQRELLSALCVPVMDYLGYTKRDNAKQAFRENFINISFKRLGNSGIFTSYGPISRLPVWIKEEIVRLNQLHGHKTCKLYRDTAECVKLLQKLIASKTGDIGSIDSKETLCDEIKTDNEVFLDVSVDSGLRELLNEISFPVFQYIYVPVNEGEKMNFQTFHQKFMQTKHKGNKLFNGYLDGVINPEVYSRIKFYLQQYYKSPTTETLRKIRSKIINDLKEIASA